MSQQQPAKQSAVFAGKQDEQILVVKRASLFSDHVPQGLVAVDLAAFEQLVRASGEFIWRSAAETDVTYKQIIPYLIFRFHGNYFVMQRKASASEVRLRNKYSMGIGGHVRREDIDGRSILQWAAREFDEEVEYGGSYTIHALGLLNDDRDMVGCVHVGLVLLLEGNSPSIAVRSELKHGTLLSLDECASHYDVMESWSQMVYDFLRAQEP